MFPNKFINLRTIKFKNYKKNKQSMKKLIDRIIETIMPYKVVLEDNFSKVSSQFFTKRFRDIKKLEKYIRNGIKERKFHWNYFVNEEGNTYEVYPSWLDVIQEVNNAEKNKRNYSTSISAFQE